jgi:UDP-N-acetylmuramoyl-L-alanyl-D-glutamate-L-lysine ligase
MLTAELAKGATHNNYVEFEDRAEGIKHAIEVNILGSSSAGLSGVKIT